MQLAAYPQISPLDDPFYPSDDGEPMADNTLQFLWITTIQGGIDALFRDRADVVVTGNCLWYPVEGNNVERAAPDVMVIFGRPKGHRGSYIQHREEGVPVQVAFEVLSPGNRAGEMNQKLAFYERHGVEEYYVLDPDFARHKGYLRADAALEPIGDLFGWTSPRLGIRFEMNPTMIQELRIIGGDGRPFEHYTKLVGQRDELEQRAEEQRRRIAAANRRAQAADRRAQEAARRAEEERLRAERLLAQLRALGLEPEE